LGCSRESWKLDGDYRTEVEQTIAELNKLAEAKRKEIAALEQEHEAKKNALFAETKDIEKKHKEVKDSFDRWVSQHVK